MTSSLTHDRPAARIAIPDIERVLFAATVCAACGLMWLAPRLPLTDLPQHAAQVALWRDLILGVSPWTDLVRINLLTPYLIGYGLMLPLSFVLPLAVVARVVLGLALLGFVAGSMSLRRSCGADRRLDWLALCGFFGFAWQWGFLTFLVAAPLGLFFLVQAHAQAQAPTWKGGSTLVLLGLLLLLAHGLVFLMAGALGGLLMFWGAWRRRWTRPAEALLPYMVLAVACIGFRLMTQHAEGAMQFDAWAYGVDLWARPLAALLFLTGAGSTIDPVLLGASVVALLAPLLLGSARNPGGGPVLFGGLVLVFLGLPVYAFQTAFLFNRFALFLLPLYGLMFRAAHTQSRQRDVAGIVLLAGACWLILGITATRIAAFGAESAAFETVLAAAEPNHRALALIHDRGSPAAGNTEAYMHYAAWYQADKHGFVDFNFAGFHPQVVRFRAGREPRITQALGWHPEAFDWDRQDGRLYDYIFVRGAADDIGRLRAASPCALDLLAQDGSWFLLGRGTCRG